MNPIQLQLQSEAALPKSQLNEAEKYASASGSSFETELRKASDSADRGSVQEEPGRSQNVAEKTQEKKEERVAKSESKRQDKTNDCDDAEKIADVSAQVQRIQMAAENQNAIVPSELPEVYEECVVAAEFSVDSDSVLLGSAQIMPAVEDAQQDVDFDVSKIYMDDIHSKAKIIDEKAEQSAEFASREIENIQSLAQTELGQDVRALNEVELKDADAVAGVSQTAVEIAQTADFSENVKLAQKNADITDMEAESKKGAKLVVHDLRTKKPTDSGLAGDKIVSKAEGAKSEPKISSRAESEPQVQMTLEMATKEVAEQNITSSSTQAAGSNGSTFHAMLSNAVQANAPEIVKMGNIILKDKNSGSINIVLKPEHLGSVKISLSLNDKLISGQITVASKEAMDAFRESIDSIKQAFTESGFDTGSFDLNFSQGSDFAQNSNQNGSDMLMNQMRGERTYGDFLAGRDEGVETDASYGGFSESSVNIVA